jgi:hypothetical protein
MKNMLNEFLAIESKMRAEIADLHEKNVGFFIDEAERYALLTWIYYAYDKRSGGAHALSIEKFRADMSHENLQNYISECRAAVDLWIYTESNRKIKDAISDIVEVT